LPLEYSAFAVDGQPDLMMRVYNPATAEDAALIAAHCTIKIYDASYSDQ
jgi:hypothetical protein